MVAWCLIKIKMGGNKISASGVSPKFLRRRRERERRATVNDYNGQYIRLNQKNCSRCRPVCRVQPSPAVSNTAGIFIKLYRKNVQPQIGPNFNQTPIICLWGCIFSYVVYDLEGAFLGFATTLEAKVYLLGLITNARGKNTSKMCRTCVGLVSDVSE